MEYLNVKKVLLVNIVYINYMEWSMDSRYERLRRYLEGVSDVSHPMEFEAVEQLVVGGLPPSARDHRAWWSNSRSHTHAKNGWLAAGWRSAGVDMKAKKLIFERVSGAEGREAAPRMPQDLSAEWSQIERRAGGLANLLGILRGVERYVEGEIAESELGRVIRRHWARSQGSSAESVG